LFTFSFQLLFLLFVHCWFLGVIIRHRLAKIINLRAV
jgi:hypothetical protein